MCIPTDSGNPLCQPLWQVVFCRQEHEVQRLRHVLVSLDHTAKPGFKSKFGLFMARVLPMTPHVENLVKDKLKKIMDSGKQGAKGCTNRASFGRKSQVMMCE